MPSSAARSRAPSSIASAWSETITSPTGSDELRGEQPGLPQPRRQLEHPLAGLGRDGVDHPVRDRRPERVDQSPVAGASPEAAASQFSRLERAVGFGVEAHASSLRSSLPERVRGSGSPRERNPLRDLVRRERPRAVGAQLLDARARRRRRPRAATTTALTASPHCSSATPNTPASSTGGWLSSTDSTSAGATFSPPLMIVSARRPSTDSQPAPSSSPRSPVCSHPSVASAAGRDRRPAHEDLAVRGDPHVGAEQRRTAAAPRPPVPRQRRDGRRGDLRARLGETVGERTPERRRRGPAPTARAPPGLPRAARSAAPGPARGRRPAAAAGWSRRGSRRSPAAREGRAGAVELEALVDARRWWRRSRCAPGSRGRRCATAAARTASAPRRSSSERHGRAEGAPQQVAVRELDLLAARRWCRRCASPARSRRGRGACAPPPSRPRRRRRRAASGSPQHERRSRAAPAAARTPTGAGRSGTAGAPSSRHACSARAKSAPGGQRDPDTGSAGDAEAFELRAPARASGVQLRVGERARRASAAPDARVAQRRRGRAIRRPAWPTG